VPRNPQIAESSLGFAPIAKSERGSSAGSMIGMVGLKHAFAADGNLMAEKKYHLNFVEVLVR